MQANIATFLGLQSDSTQSDMSIFNEYPGELDNAYTGLIKIKNHLLDLREKARKIEDKNSVEYKELEAEWVAVLNIVSDVVELSDRIIMLKVKGIKGK
jgi:hypothetical protein